MVDAQHIGLDHKAAVAIGHEPRSVELQARVVGLEVERDHLHTARPPGNSKRGFESCARIAQLLSSRAT